MWTWHLNEYMGHIMHDVYTQTTTVSLHPSHIISWLLGKGQCASLFPFASVL